MPDAIGDAIAGMTKRQLEDLVGRAQKALQTCVVCGSEHADAYTVAQTQVEVEILRYLADRPERIGTLVHHLRR